MFWNWKPTPYRVLPKLRTTLYDASCHAWHYCHHPALGVFQDRLCAMWSNGLVSEDEPGQQVLFSISDDGVTWSPPQVLLKPSDGPGKEFILTAAGFHAHNGTLVAYAGAYRYADPSECTPQQRQPWPVDTTLLAMTSTDGLHFSAPLDLHVPICPNYGPVPLASGRLLLTGNWEHAYTDDPSGLTGWQTAGFCQDLASLPQPVRDDPGYFWEVARHMGYPGGLCEGAFAEEQGVLHMLHRSYGAYLFESVSHDAGAAWSAPAETSLPNDNSKFWLGRLSSGDLAMISNPEHDSERCPLVLSLAREHGCFDRHIVIEGEPVLRKYDGHYKGGMYAYPHAVEYHGMLCIIYSVNKEDIQVASIPLEKIVGLA